MQCSGLVFEQRTNDLRCMLPGGEDAAARQIEHRVLGVCAGDRSQPPLAQCVHDASDPGPVNRPGAHRAGLGGRVNRASREKFRIVRTRRLGGEESFGVRGPVAFGQVAVFNFVQDRAGMVDEDRAERMIAVGACAFGNRESAAQEGLVVDRRYSLAPGCGGAVAGSSVGRTLPNLAFNAGKMRSGLNGNSQKRMPVASAKAFPIAAATGV